MQFFPVNLSTLAAFALGILLMCGSTSVADLSVTTLPQSALVPGGIAVVPTGIEADRAHYQNQRILLANYAGT